jgi:hypothetical protein
MLAERKAVLLLAACQALTLSAVVLSMTLAGILGAALAPDKGLATLPIAAMVVGTAIASLPASFLMRRIGAGNCGSAPHRVAGSAVVGRSPELPLRDRTSVDRRLAGLLLSPLPSRSQD